MLARVRSGTLCGVDALVVDVEVDVSSGLPQTTTVGLPDGAVREGRDRVRAAIRNSGFAYPARRVTVNLAPAGVRKEGAAFDLPIALGVLAAAAEPPLPELSSWCVLGELGLDGRVHPVRGALPCAAAARAAGLTGLLVPEANAAEAA
ncbi:MAG TPA: magnesium chelatase domain-containing protein, partial [Candidatus Limnocylindria bacterium]|nr:magnesium chelatase domain-containing protein [Candidatus Limnocylindria bacterium]